MTNQCECGLHRNPDGTFSLYSPSDCHEQGGHYNTEYDATGKFLWTSAPWQVFPDSDDLTVQEMAEAL